MKKIKFYLIFGVCFAIFANLFSSCSNNQDMELASPDGKLKVAFLFTNNQLLYQIKTDGQPILEPSLLGLVREDADFSTGLQVKNISASTLVTDAYTLNVHKKMNYTYQANQKIITVENQQGEAMQVISQVSDHGVAFRYYFPSENKEMKKIVEEKTSFAFSKTSKAWLQPCAHAKSGWGECNPSYEEHYLQDIPVGTPSPLAGWVFPALFKTGEHWVLISETAVDRNYCASRLRAESPNGVYSIGFPEDKEVVFTKELNPQSTLPWYTPWRIMAIGSLADVVESTLGTDLAKPGIAGDFSWVKPGRASWSWVLLKDGQTIYPVQKRFIDYASEMGWEYCLIDAGWDVLIGYDKIKELANYAKTKNVQLLLWYNSAGGWNSTPQTPKNALLTREARLKEFTRIKDIGIAGVKVDFFGGDGQSVMNHYIDILEDAAAVGLAVNFHGSTLPRGWQRTYPHLLSMEAIKGMEFVTFGQPDADAQPNHCAMIPFTRNVFDPMDFTPTCFGEIPNIKRKTTNGFELALPILFQSGIQHYAEIPEVMAQMPVEVQQLMKEIPNVWDETRFLDGFPGKFVVIARRSGNTWYVAGINGQNASQKINLNLSFLSSLKGFLMTDGASNREFVKKTMDFTENQSLELELISYGGFVIQLR
jgi:hypothetical protein